MTQFFFFFPERLELSFTEMRKSVRGALEVSEGNVGYTFIWNLGGSIGHIRRDTE